eukprot:TCONS_00039597-protein
MEDNKEDLEREVFDLVYQLGAPHLEHACKHLNVEDYQGKTSSQLKRKVVRKLSNVEEGDTGEDVVEGFFQEMKGLMLRLISEIDLPDEESNDSCLPSLGSRGNMGGGEDREKEEEDPEMVRFRKVFMKELKLSGRLVEPGHKDTMSYTSLYYQIRSARAHGYGDREIQVAVIKSINPNLEL